MNKVLQIIKAITGRRRTWALNNLDAELSRYLNFDFGFYIELGANDGLKQSNTMFLETYKGWNGILIEPHLDNFQRLIENRSKKNYFVNCACVSFDFPAKNYRYLYSDLMTIGLDDKNDIADRAEHAANGAKYLKPGETNQIFFSNARTLDSILRETNAPRMIDFLSLDVEGAELSVLEGINFQVFNFKYILVESRKPTHIFEFLLIRGYILEAKISFHDYLFKYCPST